MTYLAEVGLVERLRANLEVIFYVNQRNYILNSPFDGHLLWTARPLPYTYCTCSVLKWVCGKPLVVYYSI